jgi:hypothetical protein
MNRRHFNSLLTLSYPAWLLVGIAPTAARTELPVPTSTRLCQHGLSLSCCPHCGSRMKGDGNRTVPNHSRTEGVRHD